MRACAFVCVESSDGSPLAPRSGEPSLDPAFVLGVAGGEGRRRGLPAPCNTTLARPRCRRARALPREAARCCPARRSRCRPVPRSCPCSRHCHRRGLPAPGHLSLATSRCQHGIDAHVLGKTRSIGAWGERSVRRHRSSGKMMIGKSHKNQRSRHCIWQ